MNSSSSTWFVCLCALCMCHHPMSFIETGILSHRKCNASQNYTDKRYWPSPHAIVCWCWRCAALTHSLTLAHFYSGRNKNHSHAFTRENKTNAHAIYFFFFSYWRSRCGFLLVRMRINEPMFDSHLSFSISAQRA